MYIQGRKFEANLAEASVEGASCSSDRGPGGLLGGGGEARIQVFLGGGGVIGNPPTVVCNFVLLVDLPRALQQFGSAPEIPVRNPPF